MFLSAVMNSRTSILVLYYSQTQTFFYCHINQIILYLKKKYNLTLLYLIKIICILKKYTVRKISKMAPILINTLNLFNLLINYILK